MEHDQGAVDHSSAENGSGYVLGHVGYDLRREALHGRRHYSGTCFRAKTGEAIQMGAHQR